MSLIHWWPLNGDTVDRIGRNNLQYINSSGKIVTNNSGKLGKCYERTAVGSSDLLRSSETMKVFTEESICAWVYVSQHAALKTVNGVVTNHDHSTNSGLGIGVYSSDGTNYYISINAGNGSGRVHSTYWGQTNIKDAWHHVCLVSDGSTIRMYVDGKEDRAAVNYSVYSKADYLDVFCWSTGFYNQTNYRPACKVCDVRVYDHALSQAEVKELSKALVVHYTFDDVCAESTTNIITGIKSAHGKSSLYSNGVKVDWSAGGADSYFMFNYSQAIKANSVYTLSFDCEGLKSGEIATFAVSNLNPYTIALQNGRNSLTFTAGSDLMNDFTSYNRLFFDDNTRTDGALFYLTNFQLEEKDHATPYTPTTRVSMIRNEAETIQPSTISNVVLTTDSASGSYSLKCAGSTYLNHTPSGDASTGATASMWIKDMNTTGQIVAFADANSQLAFGPYGSYCCIGCVNGTNKRRAMNVSSLWKTGEWNHVVVRKDSDNIYYCYINGVETTYGATDYWTHSTYLTVGARYSGGYSRQFTGLIDDFRLYYTCLTVEEIQDLYKTKAYITDKGDIETHQFIEGKTQAQVTSQYAFEAEEFYEELYPGYDVLEYLESTGTQYVDTGYVTTSTDYTYEVDMIPTKIGGFYSYMGFMASGANPRAGIHEYSSVFMIGANATTNSSTKPVVNERVVLKGHFKSGAQKLYKNDVLIASNSTTFNHSANTLSTHIFGRNYSSGRNLTSIKLYSAKIYEGSTLVRHYIPVRRQSDNTLGLYDILTDTFCANGGSGTFTSGPAITNKNASIYEDQHVSGREIIEI